MFAQVTVLGPQNSSPGSSGSRSLSYTRRGTLPLMVSTSRITL
jgi:hypothetical protein